MDGEMTWDMVVASLEEQGFTVHGTTPWVPVQIFAESPYGEYVYFRSRGTTASMEVWRHPWELHPNIGLPARDSDWRSEVRRWEWPDAGYLDPAEAYYLFLDFWSSYEIDHDHAAGNRDSS